VPELPLVPLRRFFRLVWIGFWLNMASGAFLLIAYPTKALTNPLFYLKLVLIALGVWVLIRIERECLVDEAAISSRLAAKRPLVLLMLGAWLGVLALGRSLAYTASYILYGKGT
jgi:hypothetical protein